MGCFWWINYQYEKFITFIKCETQRNGLSFLKKVYVYFLHIDAAWDISSKCFQIPRGVFWCYSPIKFCINLLILCINLLVSPSNLNLVVLTN